MARNATVGTRVFVLDVYDVGAHIGQYVFPSRAEIDKAVRLIEEHEGLEEDDRDGYMISQYEIEDFNTWKKAYLSEVEEEEEEED